MRAHPALINYCAAECKSRHGGPLKGKRDEVLTNWRSCKGGGGGGGGKRATGLRREKPTAECAGCSGGGGQSCRRGPTDA